jgi:hypothetical protein
VSWFFIIYFYFCFYRIVEVKHYKNGFKKWNLFSILLPKRAFWFWFRHLLELFDFLRHAFFFRQVSKIWIIKTELSGNSWKNSFQNFFLKKSFIKYVLEVKKVIHSFIFSFDKTLCMSELFYSSKKVRKYRLLWICESCELKIITWRILINWKQCSLNCPCFFRNNWIIFNRNVFRVFVFSSKNFFFTK